MRADIGADLQLELNKVIAQIPAPGGQLYVKLSDGTVHSLSTGQFSIVPDKPMTATSPMKMWSISKTFTHVSILMLIESGALRPDRTLSSIEEEFPDLYQGALKHYPGSGAVTVRDLLSHTSGIIDYMVLPEYLSNWNQVLSPGAIILTASKHQDSVRPRTRSRYSNTAMLILARIIESLSGMPYERYIEERIIRPIGLKHTAVAAQNDGWGPVHGYDSGFREVTTSVSPSMVWGTGAVISCASDIGLWFEAVLHAKVLAPATAKDIFIPVKLENGADADYGLGFHIKKYANGFELYGHGGGPLKGNSATMQYSPQLKAYVVAMANGASGNANVLLGAIGWQRIAEYNRGKK
ncbi:MAG: serine hydrolase domain-containing protein [Spirochaetota bacterium]